MASSGSGDRTNGALRGWRQHVTIVEVRCKVGSATNEWDKEIASMYLAQYFEAHMDTEFGSAGVDSTLSSVAPARNRRVRNLRCSSIDRW